MVVAAHLLQLPLQLLHPPPLVLLTPAQQTPNQNSPLLTAAEGPESLDPFTANRTQSTQSVPNWWVFLCVHIAGVAQTPFQVLHPPPPVLLTPAQQTPNQKLSPIASSWRP